MERLERLEMAAEYGRSAAQRRELERDGRIVGRVGAQMEGRNAHILLWHSGAALLSILGVVYPMRSTVEMAQLIREHDGGWSHEFQSDLDQLEQYAECGCELLVTDYVRDLPSCGDAWRLTGTPCGGEYWRSAERPCLVRAWSAISPPPSRRH